MAGKRKPTPRTKKAADGPRWPLAVAKSRLSEIARLANEDGPQIITIHGRDAAIVRAISRHVGTEPGFTEDVSSYDAGAKVKADKVKPASAQNIRRPRQPERFWSEASKAIGDDLVLPDRTKVSHRDIDLE